MPELIQSVDRALEVLIYLCRQGRETGVTKIAADLGVYKSTIYRTLVTLENRGFVQKNPETEKYWLGPRLFTLGRGVENRMALPDIVRPYARRLRDAFQDTVGVSILERGPGEPYQSILLLTERQDHPGGRFFPVGSARPCHCTAAGKCLLAFSGDIDLSLYEKISLSACTGRTITTLPALRAELAGVTARGYAVDWEELEQGLVCVGAPICDHTGWAVAAVSLSGSAGRMLHDGWEERVEAVRRIAREISGSL